MRATRLVTSRTRAAALLLAGAVALSACASGGADSPEAGAPASSDAMGEPSDAMSPVPNATSPDASSDAPGTEDATSPPAAEPPLALTATRADGSTFTLADHAGKTLFVETFATWCSNCRKQLGDTNTAAGQAPDDVAFLVLSVETDLDPAQLDGYQADNGFDNLTFGVLDPESLAVLDAQFGRSVLNPPSTPKFTITPDGTLSELTTGYESVEQILAQL